MKRTIIKIDEKLCNGCGICVKGCHEGALQLLNGKAVLVSELYCDGLGACLEDCPVGAIAVEEREAEAYNERAVMERLVPKGEVVVKAHLRHLQEHGEQKLFCQETSPHPVKRSSLVITSTTVTPIPTPTGFTELSQFPIQLHLLNPYAPFLQEADLLLAADCTAFASGEFHSRFLKGRKLAIACPKLDRNMQHYINKLVVLIEEARIQSLTVLIMEVPCCNGLMRIVEAARIRQKDLPVRKIVLSVKGIVISEEWL
ncbi:MAG: 4Fe-4S ferredoxin [Tannerellaceae bacterium]|nr:4Fe-4S ferredoxin [Tannerellaceae bacterium]